jgi:CheY-like chemotaxis protein
MASTRTVLLVEDSELVVRALRRLLSRSEFSVTAAKSCDEALGQEAQFDLGVFDIDLPDGSGIQVAEQLLESGRVRRAVFFSGSSDMDDWRRAAARGAFVKKSAGAPALLDAMAAEPAPESHSSLPELEAIADAV